MRCKCDDDESMALAIRAEAFGAKLDDEVKDLICSKEEEVIPCQGTCTERGVCTCSFAKFNNKE